MKRTQIINEIIKDIEGLKSHGFDNEYALDENLAFFEAVKTRAGYIKWLFGRARQINSVKLLELSDLPLPKWDKMLHQQLMAVSRKKTPGMIEPLVRALASEIKKTSPKIVVDLGCGGMEVVRQLLQRGLLAEKEGKLIFIGVDRSPIVYELVKDNFSAFGNQVDVRFEENLTSEYLTRLSSESLKQHVIVVCKNDIFQLDQVFSRQRAGIVYHTRFKHHLVDKQQEHLDNVLNKVSNVVIEFDEYKSMSLPLVQAMATWNQPPLLNGAVLSRLRETPKAEIIKKHAQSRELKFFGLLGAYIAIRENY